MVDHTLFNKLYTAINNNMGKKIQVLFTEGGTEMKIYFTHTRNKDYLPYKLTVSMAVKGDSDNGIGRYELRPAWKESHLGSTLYFILYSTGYNINLLCYKDAEMTRNRRKKNTAYMTQPNMITSIKYNKYKQKFTLTLKNGIGCLKF